MQTFGHSMVRDIGHQELGVGLRRNNSILRKIIPAICVDDWGLLGPMLQLVEGSRS